MRLAKTRQIFNDVSTDQRDGENDQPARDFAPPVAEGPSGPSRRSFLGLMITTAAGGSVAAVAASADSPGPLRSGLDRMLSIQAEVRAIEAEAKSLPPGITPESEAQEDRLDAALRRAELASRGVVEAVMAAAGKSLDSLVINGADEDSPWVIASAREGGLVVAVTVSAAACWMFDVVGRHYCVRPNFMELPGVIR